MIAATTAYTDSTPLDMLPIGRGFTIEIPIMLPTGAVYGDVLNLFATVQGRVNGFLDELAKAADVPNEAVIYDCSFDLLD